MEKIEIIKSITERTGGDLYLGVVGAVRTGKSTFIKKFMEVCEQVFNTKLYKRAKPALENVADKLYSIFFS